MLVDVRAGLVSYIRSADTLNTHYLTYNPTRRIIIASPGCAVHQFANTAKGPQ